MPPLTTKLISRFNARFQVRQVTKHEPRETSTPIAPEPPAPAPEIENGTAGQRSRLRHTATRTISLMRNLTRADIEALPPWERRNFAAICKRWAECCDRIDGEPAKVANAGVLSDLKTNGRHE